MSALQPPTHDLISPATKAPPKPRAMSNIARLPRSLPCSGEEKNNPILEEIISRYRALRLSGLQQCPEAFSSKHVDEALLPRDAWVARVSNPIAWTFVALDENASCIRRRRHQHEASEEANNISRKQQEKEEEEEETLLLEADWLGMLTLVGPVITDDPAQLSGDGILDAFLKVKAKATQLIPRTPSNNSSSPNSSVLLYMLNGMIILRQAQRKGYGARLVAQAAEYATGVARDAGIKRLGLVLTVETENVPARALYRACGFEVTKEKLAYKGIEVVMMQRWIDC